MPMPQSEDESFNPSKRTTAHTHNYPDSDRAVSECILKTITARERVAVRQN